MDGPLLILYEEEEEGLLVCICIYGRVSICKIVIIIVLLFCVVFLYVCFSVRAGRVLLCCSHPFC